MRVLLVEDDPMLGNAITASLARHHYTADWVTSGESALHALQTDSFLLVILDISLPGISGLKVLKELRSKGDKTPVLILSARDELNDRVYGLNHGADDYLVKPFQLEELLARMGALIRRSAGMADDTIVVGDVSVSVNSHKVTVAGECINLTPNEFKILLYLVTNAGRVLSKTQILQNMHGWDESAGLNSIEVHIHNLRKKMPKGTIENIRGVGYIIQH
ncbi:MULTISPECIES: response regulator transcription factor [Vibrio]|uniref:Response regulator transcription factor n=1 Tax=Vibrio neptunius TaxID=170651 RepID=A0ABS3A2N8_9VIBR|nr:MULTISPECIES: response regulator transcription factor [Vibrio]KJY89944.1 XRE family transcriptional regulator [Vibrio neptunius]MBN3493867.1 response regulator transcription factor [Vibrio neptunius]MBN3516310.1 response regulator transcription factor [Vibrio neptunius]MBN3550537.1 response regulator transcription factor [Vibrio neptunius]MBN3574123.1 response regulator transcription factor [Vibrio neptunius]